MRRGPQPLARLMQPAFLAVAALTAVGFVIRAVQLDQSLFADELSTYWIVDGRSLGDVLDSVRSNDEITPPLYFVLGWLSLQVGPDPEWVRLPSLLAGTATIPLVYLLGRMTVGRAAGVVAAGVIALSPFMIYYSVEARSYALLIALVAASTVALLAALDGRGAGWWAAYAACSCGAMLSHYTAVFPLAAQLAWALWAQREAIRPLLLANLGALAAFAPWIPGFIADNNSPTTEILSALQPFNLDAVRFALEAWAVGYPYVRLETVPGEGAALLIAAGLTTAVAAGAIRIWRRRPRPSPAALLRQVPPRLVLVALLVLASPLGEALYSAFGTNLLGARNLNASTPGLAIAIGAVISFAGPPLAIGCAALTLSGFALAASQVLGSDLARPDYSGAASLIERRAGPRDVVIDAAVFTPVPLTAVDVYLDQTRSEFRLGLAVSEGPIMIGDPVPSPDRLTARALRKAREGDGSLFIVVPLPERGVAAASTGAEARRRQQTGDLGRRALRRLPPDFEIAERTVLPGLIPLAVYRIEQRRQAAGSSAAG